MRPLSSLDNSSLPFILDTSVCINVNATGCAEDILRSLPHELLIVDVVAEELSNGIIKGRCDANQTQDLVKAGLIEVVRLGDVGFQHFEQLVSGFAEESIDDGEAATIAYALEAGGVALIDDRKARKICVDRFENLRFATSVDIFAYSGVQTFLGRDELSEAVFNALQIARMSVPEHHLDWIIDLIGRGRAACCSSLKKSTRTACIEPSEFESRGSLNQ